MINRVQLVRFFHQVFCPQSEVGERSYRIFYAKKSSVLLCQEFVIFIVSFAFSYMSLHFAIFIFTSFTMYQLSIRGDFLRVEIENAQIIIRTPDVSPRKRKQLIRIDEVERLDVEKGTVVINLNDGSAISINASPPGVPILWKIFSHSTQIAVFLGAHITPRLPSNR